MAFIIRFWGLDWGLPYLYHPDEPHIFNNVLQLAKGEILTKEFYYYPSLIFNIHTIIFNFLHTVSKITGCCDYQQIPAFHMISSGNGYIDNPAPLLIGRLITLIFSLGVVALVYIATFTITSSIISAVVAATLSAVSPLSVIHARFVTPDTYSGFFSTAAFFSCLVIFKKNSLRYYSFAALLSGLAASTKYNAALIMLPLIAAHFSRLGLKGFRDYRLYIALLLFPVGFLIGSPQTLSNFEKYVEGFQSVVMTYSGSYPGAEGSSLLFYLNTLISEETVTIFFTLVAILFIWKSRFRKELIMAAIFIFAYLILISSYNAHFERNLMPIMGILAIIAGLGFSELLRWFRRYRLIVIIVTAIMFVIPLSRTISQTNVLIMDEGEKARLWIYENIPVSSSIAIESYKPWIDPQKYRVYGFDELIEQPAGWYLANKIDYLVAAETAYKRYFDSPDKYIGEVNSYKYLFRFYKEVASLNSPVNKITILRIK